MTKKRLILNILIGALLGIAAFLIIYGPGPLDVTNEKWILSGYVETDLTLRHAGWINYRGSSWQFPLGQADRMAFPQNRGVNISFMDSQPLFCVLFKLMSPILPETFQFEGIVALLNFVLQGIFAVFLLDLFGLDRIATVLGSVFFVFSPILMERSFRHTTLAAHYLILASMYIYFQYGRKNKLPLVASVILSIVSVSITPYFLPMVMVFLFLIAFDYAFFQKQYLKSVIYLAGNITIALLTAYAIGSIGNAYAAARKGYGFYSMNLNSIINPNSPAYYGNWSTILKSRVNLYGQWDGFNYLGVGVLLLFIGGCLGLLVHYLMTRQSLLMSVRRVPLLIVMILLTLFAITNEICFDDKVLLSIPLPDFLYNLCAIFRASSRLFYPVFYMIILASLVGLNRLIEKVNFGQAISSSNVISAVIALLCMIQLYDLSGVIIYKHQEMKWKTTVGVEIPERLLHLDQAAALFSKEVSGNRYAGIVAAKNNLLCNNADSNTYSQDFDVTYKYTDQLFAEISQGLLNINYVYVTNEEEAFQDWKRTFVNQAEFVEWIIEGKYVNTGVTPNILYFMIPSQASTAN